LVHSYIIPAVFQAALRMLFRAPDQARQKFAVEMIVRSALATGWLVLAVGATIACSQVNKGLVS
jgi:hypothetical protein